MQESVHVNRLKNADLNMYHCGTEACEPGHDYGPAVRDHYLIHYILGGKGVFYVGEKTYHLGKGQGFLICPHVVTYYQADLEDPWTYSWVGFNGLNARYYLDSAGLTQDAPIFYYDGDDHLKHCLDEIIAARKLVKSREIRLLGLLYLFLSFLIETSGGDRFSDGNSGRREFYVRKAVEYIEMNYSRDITIAQMAKYIGLDRSYLGVLFKELLGATPQEYLISFRMEKACELMQNKSLSIGDIARSVGYEDQLLFSKIFRKVKNVPPRDYRRKSFSLDNGLY